MYTSWLGWLSHLLIGLKIARRGAASIVVYRRDRIQESMYVRSPEMTTVYTVIYRHAGRQRRVAPTPSFLPSFHDLGR